MRFAVETWAPDYGSPSEAEGLAPTEERVDIGVEVPPERWAPRSPRPGTPLPQALLFIDGVRRVEARVWIEADDGRTCPGICASYAAGAVLCDGRAELTRAEVRRGLFSGAPGAETILARGVEFPALAAVGDSAEQLTLALQQRMGELEVKVAREARDTEGPHGTGADLIVVDGPLSGRQNVPGAVGYVKTHRVAYLPPVVDQIVGRLAPGQRTPLFLTTTSWSRFSWYLRLPGAQGHAWAGIVRMEAAADLEVGEVVALADQVAAVLPRFASAGHKDPRAPQNLYPIAGLERQLRRRLGDQAVIHRSLRAAAGAAGAA